MNSPPRVNKGFMRATDSLISFKKQQRHFCLKEGFHFKRIFYNIRTFLISTIYELFYYFFFNCNKINYYLFLISTIFNIYYLSTILLLIDLY